MALSIGTYIPNDTSKLKTLVDKTKVGKDLSNTYKEKSNAITKTANENDKVEPNIDANVSISGGVTLPSVENGSFIKSDCGFDFSLDGFTNPLSNIDFNYLSDGSSFELPKFPSFGSMSGGFDFNMPSMPNFDLGLSRLSNSFNKFDFGDFDDTDDIGIFDYFKNLGNDIKGAGLSNPFKCLSFGSLTAPTSSLEVKHNLKNNSKVSCSSDTIKADSNAIIKKTLEDTKTMADCKKTEKVVIDETNKQLEKVVNSTSLDSGTKTVLIGALAGAVTSGKFDLKTAKDIFTDPKVKNSLKKEFKKRGNKTSKMKVSNETRKDPNKSSTVDFSRELSTDDKLASNKNTSNLAKSSSKDKHINDKSGTIPSTTAFIRGDDKITTLSKAKELTGNNPTFIKQSFSVA